MSTNGIIVLVKRKRLNFNTLAIKRERESKESELGVYCPRIVYVVFFMFHTFTQGYLYKKQHGTHSIKNNTIYAGLDSEESKRVSKKHNTGFHT